MNNTWCLTCGKPCTKSRCTPCTRDMYNWRHQQDRQRWTPLVNAGVVTCWRCNQPIEPGTPWDLGHRGTAPKHPEHAHCNRRAQ